MLVTYWPQISALHNGPPKNMSVEYQQKKDEHQQKKVAYLTS